MGKALLILSLGFLLRVGLVELGNISWTHRYGNCVVKMHKGIYPDLHPKGGHYCLRYMEDLTMFEQITLYDPKLYEIYEEKIVSPKLKKAYEESQRNIKAYLEKGPK